MIPSWIIALVVIAFLVAVLFSADFRQYLSEQLAGIWALLATYAPIVGRFLRRTITIYGLFVLLSAVLIFVLTGLSLWIGSPIFTGICFLFSIILMIIAWLPAGVILRLFRVNSAVLPPTIRSLVAYTAFIGFIGLVFPEVFSLKVILGIALVGFISIGLSSKFQFLDKVAWPAVMIVCAVVIWNMASPNTYRSATRYWSSLLNRSAASGDRSSIRNNTVAGVTYGRIKANSDVAYFASLQEDTIASLSEVSVNLKKDSIVKIVNHKKEVMNYDGECFVEIQLRNSHGRFVGGKKVWIEADRVQILTCNDVLPENGERGQEAEQSASGPQPLKTVVLNPGSYPYPLKAGEETGWLRLPEGGKYNLSIASPRYEYDIYFYGENVSYPGGENTTLPEREHPVFKVLSRTGECVTITVTPA